MQAGEVVAGARAIRHQGLGLDRLDQAVAKQFRDHVQQRALAVGASAMQEEEARDAAEADPLKVHYNWPVPRLWSPLSAFAFLPALQLVSYAFATSLGQDVDQPRNLAKSVTVE